jgi:RNA polymerase sigma-70 factor (ECF subfamily)
MAMVTTTMAAGTEGLALAHGGDIVGPADLAGRFAAGQAGAFEEVVALYQPRVERLARRLLGWRGDVEDVVQDVFLAALTNARSFRGGSSLWTWLTAITLNRCRRHARRAAVARRFREWLGGQSRQPAGTDAGVDHAAMQDERGAKVRDAVAGLPPRDREVIVLYYLEGRPVGEVSEALGASPGAVEVRLHRARQKLRLTLNDWFEE